MPRIRRIVMTVAGCAVLMVHPQLAPTAAAHPASAASDSEEDDGQLRYENEEPGNGTEPGPGGSNAGTGNGGGGAIEQPCELTGLYSEFCDGPNACFRNDPAAIQDYDFVGLDPADKPNPDSHIVFWECQRPNGTTYNQWHWSGAEPTQVTLEQAARQAVGRLVLPEFTIRHSPPIDTLVNLDTWWWADGPDKNAVIGSDALGLRAVATPDRIEVDPGDGDGTLTCPFVTTESDTCSHTYERSSRTSPTDDDHSFTARMRLVYTIHFTLNGNRISVSGAPTELPTTWSTTEISVKEAQTVIVPNRNR